MCTPDHRSRARGRRSGGAARVNAGAGRTPSPGPGSARLHGARRGGLLAAAALAGYWLPALCAVWRPLRGPMGVEDATPDGRGYALTFDDGPHAQGTPAVLDALAARGARATFFLVGEQVVRHPALVGEIVAAGHDVGIHCHRHRNLLRLAPPQVRADLDAAAAAIEERTGRRLALYRPPYGVLTSAALSAARARGWRTVLWSEWGRDWQARATPESIARLLTHKATAGSVGLLHDADHYAVPGSWRQTAAALPRVLDTLAQRGLEPARL
jgi:peptidoglycan/xylan/chitin deacetylase (PgdA/CDA1 family)